MFKRLLIISILLILTIGVVSAADNLTLNGDVSSQGIDGQIKVSENESSQFGDSQILKDSKIETKDITAYYKEKSELVSYLKDSNNHPIANKNVNIFINDKNYVRITDNSGKVVLKLNLKPGTYSAKISFAGDDNYTSSSANSIVKVYKSSLNIKTGNLKTYFESGFHFKAKVTNKVTKNPVVGVMVVFKVYKKNKCKTCYATTDANGIAELKKNLNVGLYKVVTSVKKNRYFKSEKSKACLTIKETAEMGCSSLYVQVSNTEAVTGFRRDATNAKILHIVKYKLSGKAAVKQYKTGSYFFHSITTCDGWMMATGGWDNPTVNHAIEKLAGKMSKKGKITKTDLRKIQSWERKLPSGHFSIKSPDGKYGLVWANAIITGKLKPGEYIKVPNARFLFKHGTWSKLSKNPKDAAIEVAATDSFGVNRRDATVFHWKANTTEGKTTSKIKVYAANDNGRLVGKSTGHLIDDIVFKGKFISKNKLPKTPLSKFLGTFNVGNIDKLIKTQTSVNAPVLTKNLNESKTFDITVKDKKTKKPIANLVLKIKLHNKVFKVKTNSNGIAKFNLKSLDAGNYNVDIYTDNIRYKVSAKSTIKII